MCYLQVLKKYGAGTFRHPSIQVPLFVTKLSPITSTPTSPEPTNRYRDLSDWDDGSSQESVQWIADKKLDNAASDDLEWWREIKSLRERIDRLKKQHKRDLEQELTEAQRNLKKPRFTPQNAGTRMRKQVLHLTGGVLDAGLDSM